MSDSREHWIAADLDGTLFSRVHTAGAVAATWRDDAPSSWMPAPRHALFSRMAPIFRIVLVTARDLASFSRVRIESLPLRDGAVIANGAILLEPSTMLPDATWDAELEPLLAAWAGKLTEMCAWLGERSAGIATPRLVASNTPHPAYLVAKAHEGFWSTAQGRELCDGIAHFGCRVAEIGRELQVLPPPISKRLGLLAFARRHCAGAAPLLAFGDMPEDLGFLGEAEFLAAPATSTLGRRWRDGA